MLNLCGDRVDAKIKNSIIPTSDVNSADLEGNPSGFFCVSSETRVSAELIHMTEESDFEL